MKTNLHVFRFLLMSLLVTNGHAGEAVFHCKDKVRLSSGNIDAEDVPLGFKPFVSSMVNRLTGVSIFDGPPEDGGILKPLCVTNKDTRIKWVLEGPYENGIWVSCDYADGLIRLVQRIQEPASVCVATIKKIKPYNTLDAYISCK